MGWFEKSKKTKGPEKPQASKLQKVITPVCAKCGVEIECLNISIGDAIEAQGACLYSGSEGHLYEPMFDGVICLACNHMLCDHCLSEIVDETTCPECGGSLRQIVHHRLPKAE
jgi:hypothetical protein